MGVHRLDPLLRPKSIAVIGARARPHSVGHTLIAHLRKGGYTGDIYPINPRQDEIEGVRCYASLADLPVTVEHAIFALADEHMDAAFDQAVAHGIKAATIISTLAIEGDRDPPIKERIRQRANEAGVILCGGNCMGFYNFTDSLWTCGFETRPVHRSGGVVLLTHSGSLFTALVDSEERIDYSLAVSSGQELNTTIADYMDFALDQPETRVIGLFMEAARDPAGFEAALAKAHAKGVPVVALKVGRTEQAAHLAISHSGALAGNDAAYQALFDRYGVSRVSSIDELAMTLMVFNAAIGIGPGGLVTSHDSGGERGLIVDLGDDIGTRFAKLSPATVARLEEVLDFGLPPVNPLDRWGTGRNFPQDFRDSFLALMADPDTAIGALVLDRAAKGEIVQEYLNVAHAAHQASGKPTFLVSNHQGSGSDPKAVESTRAGVPVLDGVPAFLLASRLLFDWRDFQARAAMQPPAADTKIVSTWKARLTQPTPLDEIEGLRLLADFGVPVAASLVATSADEAVAAAESLGFPVALKSAAPGLAHKSDVDGVRLRLRGAAAVRSAYGEIAGRLGPRVAIAEMIEGPAVEMILGLTRNADFGPIVLIGFGGILAEILKDVAVAKPPFDTAHARRLIDTLRLRRLLDGVRGAPAADIDAFAAAAARFSVLAATLGPQLDAFDVNPVLVLPSGCRAVDALAVQRSTPHSDRSDRPKNRNTPS